MGMYDTFVYDCPNCGKGTESQTKLGICMLDVLEIGSVFPMDGKILMKNDCNKCKNQNMVIVEDGIIMAFANGDKAVYEESSWGEFGKIKRE